MSKKEKNEKIAKDYIRDYIFYTSLVSSSDEKDEDSDGSCDSFRTKKTKLTKKMC